MNSEGLAWPSITVLARDVGLTRRHVFTITKEATASGWLTVEEKAGPPGRGGPVNRYRATFPPELSKTGEAQFTSSQESGDTQFTSLDPSETRSGEPQFTEVVNPSSPRSVKEAKEKNTGEPDSTPTPDVMAVFEYWVAARARAVNRNGKGPTPKPTQGRLSKVRARIQDGYSIEDLKTAVDGCLGNPFNIEGGFTDLELICRSDAKVEQYLAWAKKHRPPPSPTDQRTGRW